MKKVFPFIVLVVLAAVAATVYWYAPAREVVVKYYQLFTAPQEQHAEVVSAPESTSAEEIAPTPSVEPVVEPAPVEEPAPAEHQPEPEPAPVAESAPLPALNAEAEALLPKAEAGDPVAQFNLARLYVLGEDMAVNQTEFIRWCRTAAEQGLPEAQYTLGMCYRQGLGVELNTNEARAWVQKAADARYIPAVNEMKR